MSYDLLRTRHDYVLRDQLHIIRRDPGDRIAILGAAVFTVHDDGTAVEEPPPFLRGRGREIEEFLQAVLDFAWKEGLRPKGHEPVEGELRATKAHLDDMRRLAKVLGAVEGGR